MSFGSVDHPLDLFTCTPWGCLHLPAPACPGKTSLFQAHQCTGPEITPIMRKLMFSPKSNKLTHRKETPSPPRTAESVASRASDDLARSPRPSLSSASPGTTNARNAGQPSMTPQDLKVYNQFTSTSPPPTSSSLAPNQDPGGTPRRMASIRPVTSFDDDLPVPSADSSVNVSPSLTNGRSESVLSSSPNSNTSAMSPPADKRHTEQNGTDRVPASRLRPKVSAQYLRNVSNGDAQARSKSPSGQPRSSIAERPIDIPQRDSSLGGAERSAARMGDGQDESNFDSAVGKAGLGKTGRVMNRLISENESLKRDLQIEKLNSEESRREAKLLADKMERMVADYENRLLEANVTKTLLARKERQVESLQAAVDLEKKRTADAQGRERTWKDEMEKIRVETTKSVEEATALATMMEGRYNAISSHWKDQGDEVKRSMAKMGKEVADLLEARRKDDEKIVTLRDLCDQQDTNIKELLQQKEALWQRFEAYKKEQEDALRNIKSTATEREAQQTQMLSEAKEVVDKLKWALNVKNKIEWAR